MGVEDPAVQWPAVLLNDSLQEKVQHARILAVGAGGIGCELLKTLVLSGFESIEVIDMDTIETSNLNRQFLFRRQHVGQSKAAVAAEAVRRFRPSASIKAHQANVKEPQFGVDFFSGFTLVLNGLDNLDARRHVNRLCLAAKVPLIESGTAGYLGQVTVHARIEDEQGKAFQSECFECQPKPAPKTYPVCTIRNTPDKPIHCVVWAKELLFQRLFGRPDEVSDLDEGATATEAAEAEREAAAAERADPSAFLPAPGELPGAYARRIFERVFYSDVVRLLEVEDLWKARQRPEPLRLVSILASPTNNGPVTANGYHHTTGDELTPTAAAGPADQQPTNASQALGLTNDHAVWDLLQNTQVFLRSIELFLETRASDIGAAVFDKDDALAVEFVTAAANLRSHVFHIPRQSMFDLKGMAGNIVHAIATTNAAIAGLIVVEAYKILAGMPERCKTSYLNRVPNPKRMISTVECDSPNPSCAVCSHAQLHLDIDTLSTTLRTFVAQVLKGTLSLIEPSISCGDFLYEEGSGLEDDEIEEYRRHLDTPLASLPPQGSGGLGNGAVVEVRDQAQSIEVKIVVRHQADWDEEAHPLRFTLSGERPQAHPGPAAEDDGPSSSELRVAPGTAEATALAGNASEDDDVVVIVNAATIPSSEQRTGKRKLEDLIQGSSKRARQESNAQGPPVIMID